MASEWRHAMWHSESLSGGGAAMAPYLPRRPVDEKSLTEVIALWQSTPPFGSETFDTFYKKYDGSACSDWAKMQPDGKDFGGAWDAPEGSEERRDAWDITRRANGVALAALPYPAAVILYTVEYLCARRCESVNRVADWLAWVRAEARVARKVDLPLTAGLFPRPALDDSGAAPGPGT